MSGDGTEETRIAPHGAGLQAEGQIEVEVEGGRGRAMARAFATSWADLREDRARLSPP